MRLLSRVQITDSLTLLLNSHYTALALLGQAIIYRELCRRGRTFWLLLQTAIYHVPYPPGFC